MVDASAHFNKDATNTPVRGGFIKVFRDDLQPLYGKDGFYMKVFCWLRAHCAFTNQIVDQWGGLVSLAPGECSFSYRKLSDRLAMTLAQVKEAITFLEKNDLMRLAATKTGTKAIFPEAASWASCAKRCAKKRIRKASSPCTKSNSLSSMLSNKVSSTDCHTLSDKKNERITVCYRDNLNDGNMVSSTDFDTHSNTDFNTVATHNNLTTPATPEVPLPKNAGECSIEILSLGAVIQGQEEGERDFYEAFVGKEKEVGDEFKKQFSQGVRGLKGNQTKLAAAVWMLYQAKVEGKKIESPIGYFNNLISPKGEIGEPPTGWNPFIAHDHAVYSPPPVLSQLSEVKRSTPEDRERIKQEVEAKRKASAAA